ncbi:MAG TPA: NAD(P)H-quinone oxidoreductase [Rhizomicrobium sp.]|nr:NAD(P)H-quinone oxidoreductase [Rhizomicrobium sp.]
MKAIVSENPGPGFRLRLGEIPMPVPGPDQVLIKVAAAGVNRADLHQARGTYPPPPGAPETLGMEVAGHVVEDSGLYKKGDPVCALIGGGGYGEYAVADKASVLRLPPSLDVTDAASLPEGLFTAWTNVMDTGRLKSGETLLIHGGTSGVGVMAIQMFAALGHAVFATAGSPEKCALCENLGARRAINYREEDFVAAVKASTGGKGADVILDMVGGGYVQRNMSAASVWGRIVNIAYQDGAKVSLDLGPMLMKRLTLAATILRARSVAEKGAIRDALLETIWPMVADGRIRPVVDRRFSLADAQKALEYMEKPGATGKILLLP